MRAYSPPLTAMSYYDVTERNTLRRNRTELTGRATDVIGGYHALKKVLV